jgi:hypothetical protein
MTYEVLKLLHIVGAILIGGGLIGVWVADMRSRQLRDLSAFSEAVRNIAVFYDGVVVPGALILLASGTWLIAEFFGGWSFVRCNPGGAQHRLRFTLSQRSIIMMGTLTKKVALVTSGSRSIGAATAKRLAADGAAVALTYSASPDKADEVVRAIEAAGGKALAIRADAGDVAAVKAAVAKTVQTFGRLDILVNNAGVAIVKPVDGWSGMVTPEARNDRTTCHMSLRSSTSTPAVGSLMMSFALNDILQRKDNVGSIPITRSR